MEDDHKNKNFAENKLDRAVIGDIFCLLISSMIFIVIMYLGTEYKG